jgi:hypothetical protein
MPFTRRRSTAAPSSQQRIGRIIGFIGVIVLANGISVIVRNRGAEVPIAAYVLIIVGVMMGIIAVIRQERARRAALNGLTTSEPYVAAGGAVVVGYGAAQPAGNPYMAQPGGAYPATGNPYMSPYPGSPVPVATVVSPPGMGMGMDLRMPPLPQQQQQGGAGRAQGMGTAVMGIAPGSPDAYWHDSIAMLRAATTEQAFMAALGRLYAMAAAGDATRLPTVPDPRGAVIGEAHPARERAPAGWTPMVAHQFQELLRALGAGSGGPGAGDKNAGVWTGGVPLAPTPTEITTNPTVVDPPGAAAHAQGSGTTSFPPVATGFVTAPQSQMPPGSSVML